MLTVFHAFLLGMVQGLTEFLPISSSGHLVLIPYIFRWNYQGLSFDVALHAGTAIAIVIYFGKDWMAIIKNAFIKGKSGENSNIEKYPNNLLWQILAASIPAGILGLAIDKYIEKNFHSVLFIAFNFAFFGFLLWYSDKKSKSDQKPEKLTYKKSFLIGLSQAIALVPGVSRSGITLTASRLIGFKREEAVRFSFLLATPTIVGAFLVKLPDILKGGIGINFWVGTLTATIFGLLAIKFLFVYLKKRDFSIFLWYRLLIALLIVVLYFLHH